MIGKDFAENLDLAKPLAQQRLDLPASEQAEMDSFVSMVILRLHADLADKEIDWSDLEKDLRDEFQSPKVRRWVDALKEAARIFEPQHEMARVKVRVPTITRKTRTFEDVSRMSVCVQWFGEGDRIPKESQFFFDLMTQMDSPFWYGMPEAFRVVFLGQVKNWPNPEATKVVADRFGTLESYVALVTSGEFRKEHPTRLWDAPTFACSIILLGDPNCGVISPAPYYNPGVQEEESAKVEKSLTLAERLYLNPDLELPGIGPLNFERGACSNCEQFQNSYDGKPAVPEGGSCNDPTYICPQCNRGWWQMNGHFHLWQLVRSESEWNRLRRESILAEAGLLYDEG